MLAQQQPEKGDDTRVELRVIGAQTARFDFWESLTITSDFLTPCDTFSLSAGGGIAGVDIARQIPIGTLVEVRIGPDWRRVVLGFVDSVRIETSRDGGTSIRVEGRDFLSPVVDGNVNPYLKIPKSGFSLFDLAKMVIKDQFFLDLGVLSEGRTKSVEAAAYGTDVTSKLVGDKQKSYKGKHRREDPIKDITPKFNEGAFSYLSRVCSHYGYWLWANQEFGYVVLSIPIFDQPASYTITSRYAPSGGFKGSENNVLRASMGLDQTSVPSTVFVHGVAGDTAPMPKGLALDTRIAPYKPVYIKDEHATTQGGAERIARLFLARQQRNFATYECTVSGFFDPTTKALYEVNRTANVIDEHLGVEGVMWVESRTFRKSRSEGSVTDLKLIPCGTLVLDYQPEDSVPSGTVDIALLAQNVGKDAPSKASPSKNGVYVLGRPQTVRFMNTKLPPQEPPTKK